MNRIHWIIFFTLIVIAFLLGKASEDKGREQVKWWLIDGMEKCEEFLPAGQECEVVIQRVVKEQQ